MLAAGKGHGDVVAALLEASAEVNTTDDEGLTALLRAERKGKWSSGLISLCFVAVIRSTSLFGLL